MSVQRAVRNICILVVIGVLLIVAFILSINIPNAIQFYGHAKMTKAEAEIRSIEIALTAVLADVGYRDYRSLLDEEAYKRASDIEIRRSETGPIAASIEIYSTVAFSLMRHGNDTAEVLKSSDDTKHLADLIPREALRRLGNVYMDEIGADPWGTPYRFFFGPWPENYGPIVFRTYIDTTPEAESDHLTTALPNSGSPPSQVGFAAPSTKPFYIWSLGKNKISDQAIYDSTGEYAPPASQHYRSNAPSEFKGGGDDINNWDDHRSYETLYR